MPPPFLHIFHPNERGAPHLSAWLAHVQTALRTQAKWDGCKVRCVAYDNQASFNVASESALVRQHAGPVIFLQKVQSRLYEKFLAIVKREVSVYIVSPGSAEDILCTIEQAAVDHAHGEPSIQLRELVAYLIIAKLARYDKWGGTATNKAFMWIGDIPNGGFPKDVCDTRTIYDVVDHLFNMGLLTRKKSGNEMKYALGDKELIQPILDKRIFDERLNLDRYFNKSERAVSSQYLWYRDD